MSFFVLKFKVLQTLTLRLFEFFVIFSLNSFQPPRVKCATTLWHPNISVSGDICLSLLRQNSIDGLGWAPTRRLKDVVWGLNSLFTVSFYFLL